MESSVIKVLNTINVPVVSRDIVAAHRIGEAKELVICRMLNRKDAELAIKNRKKLKDLDATSIGFEAANGVYIQENYCPLISKLGFFCRLLYQANRVFETWMGRGKVFVKMTEAEDAVIIEHPDDLYDAFPDFNFPEG